MLPAPVSGRSLPVLQAGLWTLSVGHTLGFAALFVDAWRLHAACSVTAQPAGRVLLWMVLLDVLVLTSWQILDPLRWVELQHGAQGDAAGQDVVVQSYSQRCSSTNMDLWLTAVYGYKGPLLGLGCFLAWSIRAVQVEPPAVSSRHLSLSVFAVTASSVSGASASLLTSHNPPVQFCLTSALILGCNTLALLWLFGPKLSSARWGGSELQTDAAEADDDEQQLRTLNQQLKGHSAQLDVQIETLSMQLCERAAGAALQRPAGNHAGGSSVTWTHVVQVCPEEKKPSSPDSINSPEQLRRRLSVTLPILHHAYLPAVGGVSASSSSLFGSQEAFVHC